VCIKTAFHQTPELWVTNIYKFCQQAKTLIENPYEDPLEQEKVIDSDTNLSIVNIWKTGK
jgi:hypothetical protein